MKTIQNIIEEYQNKIDMCDSYLNKIKDLIVIARKEGNESTIEDLSFERANCNRDRQLYIQFIKDLEDII